MLCIIEQRSVMSTWEHEGCAKVEDWQKILNKKDSIEQKTYTLLA
jgi:hypothetical protein